MQVFEQSFGEKAGSISSRTASRNAIFSKENRRLRLDSIFTARAAIS